MKAIVFHYSLPRFAFAYLFGLITPRAYLGVPGPLALEEIPEPQLPADDWAVVRTRFCGICGSDLKEVFLDGSFDNPLTSLISFPAVLGHEVAGTIERVGPGVTSRRVEGELRVTFNGQQAEWCAIAWQYVATQPGDSYRLRSEFRGIDVDSPDGICWKIYDLAGRRVGAGTDGGGSLTFVAPSDVLVLMLSYERQMGLPRLAGTVAITQVTLGMER